MSLRSGEGERATEGFKGSHFERRVCRAWEYWLVSKDSEFLKWVELLREVRYSSMNSDSLFLMWALFSVVQYSIVELLFSLE